MIVAEILAYKADIVCLQEVDASVHNSLLHPVLTSCGYQGFYSNKVGTLLMYQNKSFSSSYLYYFDVGDSTTRGMLNVLVYYNL